MAAPLPAAHQATAAAEQAPQYSLPAYTPEQQYVQKRQAEEITKDARHMAQLDATKGFETVQDAVMCLLPFHLFNAEDPSLADLDDTPDHMGADLMASRHDAWEELCMSKANDLRKRAEATSSSIAELGARMQKEALSGTRSIDHFAMARIQQDDLRRKIAADQAELQKLLPPPSAKPASAPAPAAPSRATHVAPGAAQGTQAAYQAAAAAAARATGAGRGQQPALSLTQLQLLGLYQQQQALQQQALQQPGLQQAGGLTAQQRLAILQAQAAQAQAAQLPQAQQLAALQQAQAAHAAQLPQAQQLAALQQAQLPQQAQQAAVFQALQQQALQQQQQLLAQVLQAQQLQAAQQQRKPQ